MGTTTSFDIRSLTAFACGLTLAAGTAAAQQSPNIVFGVVDDDEDGTADSFLSDSLQDSISDRFDDQATFAEYSIAGAEGPVVESAVIAGQLEEEFSFGFGTSPATVSIEIYAGNGAADLSDFSIAATEIGTVTLVDGDPDLNDFSFDATDAVQTVLDAGADFVGLRVSYITEGAGQARLNNPTLTASFVPSPGSLAMLGLGGLAAARRRR